MIFRPDIKPPMWGPPDAVQFAVRHNAERMGIDLGKSRLLMPLWEGGGFPVDLSSRANHLQGAGVGWTLGGVSPSNLYIPNESVVSLNADFTIICIADINSLPTANHNIFGSAKDINTGWTLFVDNDDYGAKYTNILAFDRGTTHTDSGRPLSPNNSIKTGNDILLAAAYRHVGTTADMYVGDNYSLDGFDNVGVQSGDGKTYIGPTASGFTANAFPGVIKFIAVVQEYLYTDVILQFNHEPYALLMPVARPFIFDMAGGIFAIDSVLQSQGVTAPAVNQKISVTISSVTQSQSVDTQTASQMHTVSPANVTQSQSVDAQTVTQLVTLSLADVSQSQTVEAPTVAQTHGMTTDSVSQGQTATTLTAAQLHEIITANVGQSQTLNSVTVTITGALVIHSVMQSQSAGSVSLDQLIALAVDSVLQGQTIDEPSLATINLINIDDVSQSQSLGTVSLSQVSALIIDAINQGQQIENVTFSIAKGRVTVTIEARSPGVNFNARKPGITFN